MINTPEIPGESKVHCSFRNKPKKISAKKLRFAVKTYADCLFSKKLQESLDICILFRDDLSAMESCQGRCDPHPDQEDTRYPRAFLVQIDSVQSTREIYRTIAHEFRHVAQFAQGKLKEFENDRSYRWEKKDYKIDSFNPEHYWLSPWEIEANGWEEGLYQVMTIRWKQLRKK